MIYKKDVVGPEESDLPPTHGDIADNLGDTFGKGDDCDLPEDN